MRWMTVVSLVSALSSVGGLMTDCPDLSLRHGAQVDPFVDMSVRDGRSQRTKTIWNNKDPVFNQVLSFIVDDPEHQSITAMVKDDDMHAFSKVCSIPAQSALEEHSSYVMSMRCHCVGMWSGCCCASAATAESSSL